jgi:hypothetical protein
MDMVRMVAVWASGSKGWCIRSRMASTWQTLAALSLGYLQVHLAAMPA